MPAAGELNSPSNRCRRTNNLYLQGMEISPFPVPRVKGTNGRKWRLDLFGLFSICACAETPSVPVSCLVLVDCESVAIVLSIKGQAIIISCYYILLW